VRGRVVRRIPPQFPNTMVGDIVGFEVVVGEVVGGGSWSGDFEENLAPEEGQLVGGEAELPLREGDHGADTEARLEQSSRGGVGLDPNDALAVEGEMERCPVSRDRRELGSPGNGHDPGVLRRACASAGLDKVNVEHSSVAREENQGAVVFHALDDGVRGVHPSLGGRG